MTIFSYRARYVFPVSSPPLENGVVEVTEGVISAVHNRPDPRAVDLGNVAIIPGLVNAHTHLEFSELREPIKPAEPFTDWIRALLAHRKTRQMPPKTVIALGFEEILRTGSAALGEIATQDCSPEVFLKARPETKPGTDSRCQAVVFRELLGLAPERIEDQLAIAREHLESSSPEEGGSITRGLSPHAPYSVHPDMFHQVVSLCKEHRAPLAMHLAETPAELELLDQGTGEFVQMLSGFGVWREGIIPKGTRIRDYLEPLAELDRGLVVHGNYLSDEDIAFLAKHPQLSVVYCPRTHAYFGHRNHPWPQLIDAGVRVVLGTDSRASNPDLDVWEEVKFLSRRHPNIPPDVLLSWATRDGAVALYGPETKLGRLEPGHAARLTFIPLAETSADDPYRLLLM